MSEYGEIDIQEAVGKMPNWWSAVVHCRLLDWDFKAPVSFAKTLATMQTPSSTPLDTLLTANGTRTRTTPVPSTKISTSTVSTGTTAP
jgi:hypothetical protein